MSPTPIQMRRPRLSVKLSLLVYTAEAPLHSCRRKGQDLQTSRSGTPRAAVPHKEVWV